MILLAINKIDGLNLFIRCLKICGFGLVLLVHGRSLTILPMKTIWAEIASPCLFLMLYFDILIVIMCFPVKTEIIFQALVAMLVLNFIQAFGRC